MEALYLLLPISLVFVLLIGVVFWWAIFSGQFDETDAAARSILQDDDSTAEDGDSPVIEKDLDADRHADPFEQPRLSQHAEPK